MSIGSAKPLFRLFFSSGPSPDLLKTEYVVPLETIVFDAKREWPGIRAQKSAFCLFFINAKREQEHNVPTQDTEQSDEKHPYIQTLANSLENSNPFFTEIFGSSFRFMFLPNDGDNRNRSSPGRRLVRLRQSVLERENIMIEFGKNNPATRADLDTLAEHFLTVWKKKYRPRPRADVVTGDSEPSAVAKNAGGPLRRSPNIERVPLQPWQLKTKGDNPIQAVTTGQIDTTTVYGAMAAFSYRRFSKADAWARQNAFELMAILSTCDNLYIAPPKPGRVQRTDKLGTFLAKLKARNCGVGLPAASDNQIRAAQTLAHEWVDRSLDKLCVEYARLQTEAVFDTWLTWHVDYAWEEHCRTVGGLCRTEVETSIAKVLGVDRDEISAVNLRAKDPKGPAAIVRDPIQPDFKLAKGIYVVSALIRGVEYNYLSMATERHFFAHQLRENCPARRTTIADRCYDLDPMEALLIRIMIEDVFEEETLDKKLDRFAFLAALRRERRQLHRPVRPGVSVEDAARRAVKEDLNMNLTKRVEERAFEAHATPSLLKTSFRVTDWDVLLEDAAGLRETFHAHLGDLRYAEPGRVERHGVESSSD